MSPTPPMSPTLRWFVQVARVEGLTVLLLFGLGMPLKYGLGIKEPLAWIGWIHGVMVFLYLIALGSASRVEAWSWGRTLLGFIVSLVPFGTFWFERSLRGTKK